MFKKIFISGLLIISMFISGCQPKETNSDSKGNSVATYQTLPVPEDGWTGEDALKALYINGQQFAEPFTVESLGQQFTINTDKTSFKPGELSNVILNYQDEEIPFLTLNISGVNDFNDLYTTTPRSINVLNFDEEEIGNKSQIIFNGVTLGVSLKSVEKAFGEPTNRTNNSVTITYENKNNIDKNCLGFTFSKEGKLNAFTILLKN